MPDLINFYLEIALFVLALFMILFVEIIDRNRNRKRFNRITNFTVRGSLGTTDSFIEDTRLIEFMKNTQLMSRKEIK